MQKGRIGLIFLGQNWKCALFEMEIRIKNNWEMGSLDIRWRNSEIHPYNNFGGEFGNTSMRLFWGRNGNGIKIKRRDRKGTPKTGGKLEMGSLKTLP